MRKAWDIFKLRVVGSLAVIAFVITVCLAIIILQKGYLELSTYFARMVATAIFIGLVAWLSALIKRDLPLQNTPPKAESIGEPKLAESPHSQKHQTLDDILFRRIPKSSRHHFFLF